jgi:HEAT repeat protein
MLDNEIWMLSLLTLSVSSILFILLLYLVVRKMIEVHHQNRIEQAKAVMHPLILNYLMDGTLTREIRLNTRVAREAAEELFKQFAEVLVEQDIQDRIAKLTTIHLQGYYRKKLKSKRWSTRMNVLYHIEDLRIEALLPDLLNRLNHRRVTHEEKVQMLRILATFQHPAIVQYLTTLSFLSDSDYRGILLRLDRNLLDILLLGFYQSNKRLRYALLDVIAIKNDLHYVHLVETVFDHSNGEERIRAYKTLIGLGYVKNKQKFIQLAHSPIWEERMLTAKLLGSLKEVQDLPALYALLRDANWWVRFQAGQAIYGYREGKEILMEIVKEDEDSFARDMAREWLQRGAIE